MKNSISSIFWLPLIAFLLLINSCDKNRTNNTNDFEQTVRSEALEYFETFAQRSDWEKFCSFYREDVHFKDIALQLELDSLWKFKRFYNWEGEGDRFKKLSPEQKHLNLKSLVVEGNVAVGRGRFNPYYYDDYLIDSEWGMEFTIWLRFDENLKIMEQIDWMEYDPITLENIIKRFNEDGFKAIEDWLDLSEE